MYGSVRVIRAEEPISDAAIGAQLARILSSPSFHASERSRSFLGFVVAETLAGRAERIKAFTVAVEVFGRDHSFDTQGDPVVRLEAGRLRRSLGHYYLTEGRDDPIVIAIPKGGYQPIITARVAAIEPKAEVAQPSLAVTGSRPGWRRPALLGATGAVLLLALLAVAPGSRPWSPTAPRQPAAGLFRPSVLVVPFTDRGVPPVDGRLVQGLTDQIVAGLTRFRELEVFGRVWPGRTPAAGDPLQQAQALGASHLLEGSVATTAEQVRVNVRLHAVANGATVWSATYDRDLRAANLFAIQDQIAAEVALRIAQPAGELANARPAPGDRPDDLAAYGCTLDFYAYRRSYARDQQPLVLACLEQTVAQHPDYATAWAMLALVRIDSDRFYFPAPSGGPSALESAVAAARQAIALDPADVRAWQALMQASYLRSDVAEGRAAGERALQLNPNDLELVGEFGMRLAMAGDWERGTAMMRSAVERDPGSAAVQLSVLAIDAMRRGRYQEAVDLLDRAGRNGAPTMEMVRAAALGYLGRVDEARSVGERGMAGMPGVFSRLDAEFDKRNFQPEIRHLLLDGWRRAGLPVPDGVRVEPSVASKG